MIVRNEADHLERCLASVRGLVDEMVIVDTGSTDRTVEIARAAGGRLVEAVWADDFSRARNAGLDQATGDWILVLDADESLASRDHAAIRGWFERDVDAVVAVQRHYVRSTPVGWQAGSGGYDEGRPFPGFFDVKCRRLFRNRTWLRFTNIIHEELISTDPSRPLRQAEDAWVIHHFGKVDPPDRLRAKAEHYLRIGAKKIAEHPDDPQAQYELGVQHATLGQAEAALACFARVQALRPGFRDVALQAALCHARLGQHESALEALDAAARALPDHAAEIAVAKGNVHRRRGDLASAALAFQHAVGLAPAFAAAHAGLALVHSLLGRHDDAYADVNRGLAASPLHPDLWLERARQRFVAGDDAGALADVESAGTSPSARLLRARILIRQGRLSEADASLQIPETATCDAEQRGAVAALRGALALGQNDINAAIPALRQSLNIAPSYEAARNLSMALDGRGDARGACEAAAEAFRATPNDEWAIERLATLTRQLDGRPAPEEPDRPLTVVFYQPNSLNYDGWTPRERGLGGTESAVVYLAEALAVRGHHVAVLNACETTRTIGGVEYARWELLPLRCLRDRPDVIVAVRSWNLIGRVRLAPVQIYWTGDAADQPSVAGLGDASARAELDVFMLQSDWQANTFEAAFGLSPWHVVKTKLGSAASGVHDEPSDVATPPVRRPRRLAYISTPYRGLDVLLDLFPRIRAACPDAELDVFSSMTVYGATATEDEQQFGALYARARQPGVRLFGSLPQPAMTMRLREIRVLAYPSHFAETFCIAAIEAQAAGCPVVTSDLGALAETVGNGGLCISGDPRTPAYQQAFVDACVKLLLDDGWWHAASARASSRATAYAWPEIAAHWERTCRLALTNEPDRVARIATHLRSGRKPLALQMWTRTPRPASVPASAWESLGALLRWHAGHGERPSPATQLDIALCFRSLRSDEFLSHAPDCSTADTRHIA